MFSPLYKRKSMQKRLYVGGSALYKGDTPYEDKSTIAVSPDGELYSAVKTDEIYFTKVRTPHYCTVLGDVIVQPRVSMMETNINLEVPKVKIATDYGNIWYLPQKHIGG